MITRLKADAPVLLRHLIDPRGRCDRQGFFALALALVALQVLIGSAIAISGKPLNGSLSLALNAPLIWFGCTATLKRIHDIGRSGWWILAAFVLWIVGSVVITTGVSLMVGHTAYAASVAAQSGIFWVSVAAIMVPAFGGLLWLHSAAGAAGENRFGPVTDGLGFSLPRRSTVQSHDDVPSDAMVAN